MIKRRPFAATLLALVACAPIVAGCHRPPNVEAASGSDAPPGQAWLTPEQVNEAHIVVAPVNEEDVDDTILSSGRVTFDDQRVAHIFSPVTGRVARITANLGERLTRGQPLAVITSPDIGQASSDLGKADADLIAAEHDYQRKKDLLDAHAASRADYETSEDNYRKAKAEKERAYQKAFLLRTGSVDAVSQG
jgi:cobalt-zinc-cadmium efflux system membrane fusion protein